MAQLLRVTNVNNDVHLIGMMKIKRFVLNCTRFQTQGTFDQDTLRALIYAHSQRIFRSYDWHSANKEKKIINKNKNNLHHIEL